MWLSLGPGCPIRKKLTCNRGRYDRALNKRIEKHMIQDLRSFKLPANFRGRSTWFVQFWWLVQATLFRCSPQVAYAWRRWLLRLFGAKIGKGVLIRSTVEIT